MDKNRILQRELAKIGALGGFIGGFAGGALGGGAGAWFAARFLPTETDEAEIHLHNCPLDTAAKLVANTLASLGSLVDNEDLKTPNPIFAAIVGSGFLSLNPCIVTVELVSYDTETVLCICAAAKEGLIKQRTASKAVNRVISAISMSLDGGAAGSESPQSAS